MIPPARLHRHRRGRCCRSFCGAAAAGARLVTVLPPSTLEFSLESFHAIFIAHFALLGLFLMAALASRL